MTKQEFLDKNFEEVHEHFTRITELMREVEEENDRLRGELEQLKDMLHKFTHTADILDWLESKEAEMPLESISAWGLPRYIKKGL